MREALQTIQALIGQALDLLSVLADFLRTSSVSLQVSAFVGVVLVAFLLGLLLGRVSKPKDPGSAESLNERRDERVVLDLERLTPLGVSEEEEVEAKVMDISGLRKADTVEGTSPDLMDSQQRPETAPQR